MQYWSILDTARIHAAAAFRSDFIYDQPQTYLDALAEAHATLQDQFGQDPSTRDYWTARNAVHKILFRTAMWAQDGDHGDYDPETEAANPTYPVFLHAVGESATIWETENPQYNHWDDFDAELTTWRETLNTEYALEPAMRDRVNIQSILESIGAAACMFASHARFTKHDRDPHTRENYAVWQEVDGQWTLRDNHCNYGSSPAAPDFPPNQTDETLCLPCSTPQGMPRAAHLATTSTQYALNLPADNERRWRWIDAGQFARDLSKLLNILPRDVAAVAGIPRGGLTAAAYIASALNKPLLAANRNGPALLSATDRRGEQYNPRAPILLVDDDLHSGHTMNNLRKTLGPTVITAAVYQFTGATHPVNYAARCFPCTWLASWKMFSVGNWLNPHLATDFDGILCNDCPATDDDDGPRYETFLQDARPLWNFNPHRIPVIITARLEKWRGPTHRWLERHGVQYNALYMHQASCLANRTTRSVIIHKATHFQNSCLRFFIESDPHQAEQIALRVQRPIICPTNGIIYNATIDTEPRQP